MSEINETNELNEVKEQEVKTEKSECSCKVCKACKEVAKKVLVIALGTCIGVYSGLSLFAVTHKPKFKKFNAPMSYQMPYHGHNNMKGHKHFHGGEFKGAPEHFKGDFKGGPKDFKAPNGDFEKKPIQH